MIHDTVALNWWDDGLCRANLHCHVSNYGLKSLFNGAYDLCAVYIPSSLVRLAQL